MFFEQHNRSAMTNPTKFKYNMTFNILEIKVQLQDILIETTEKTRNTLNS